jgi:predicted NAD-dependent protein-ADP-ribosyltransferase YbiA (DUF1768 family)
MRETDKYIAFTRVRLKYGWMSNMSHHPIEFVKKWPNGEALFQALRLYEHPTVVTDIWRQKNPMKAKGVAKRFYLEEGLSFLDDLDIRRMKLVTGLKLNQYPDLMKELIDSEDKIIYEDVSKRIGDDKSSSLFWGAALIQNKHWIGMNILGECYMEWRDIIRRTNQVYFYSELSELFAEFSPCLEKPLF